MPEILTSFNTTNLNFSCAAHAQSNW